MSVVARRGLAATRHHADVAEEAGVSTATVFVYFPTREDLIGAVLGEVEGQLAKLTEPILARALPARRNALDLLRAFADWVGTHPDHARIWIEWGTAIREDFWPRYLDLIEWHVQLWKSAIERGQREGGIAADLDPYEVARLIVGSGHMIVQLKFAGHEPEKVDHFIRSLVRAATGTED
ncbi:MAG: TetR/AcrR family transcriptional regulator [Rhodospirillales bacterium]|nr:TetR/AcrR family transcriptional regulator [Rhodospirillales bacterium]